MGLVPGTKNVVPDQNFKAKYECTLGDLSPKQVPERSPCNQSPRVCGPSTDEGTQAKEQQAMEIAAVIIQALITLIKLNYAIGRHAKSAKFEFQIDSGYIGFHSNIFDAPKG